MIKRILIKLKIKNKYIWATWLKNVENFNKTRLKFVIILTHTYFIIKYCIFLKNLLNSIFFIFRYIKWISCQNKCVTVVVTN